VPKRAMPITEAEKERQQEVLTKLREDAGLSPTKAAGLIGVSYSQLLRYESGETILPTNYYRAVATAYGITKAALSFQLGLVDRIPPDGPLEEMLAAIGMPVDEIVQLTSRIGSDPTTPDERAKIVAFVARVLRKRAANGGQGRRRA
jgi:transcriptional regulator with XRE-family HTH domain